MSILNINKCVEEYNMAIKKKFSIDYWDGVYEGFEEYVKNLSDTNPAHINKGYVMNYMLDTFLDIDEDVKKEVYAFFFERMKMYARSAGMLSGFEKAAAEKKLKDYEKLVNLFNDFGIYKEDPTSPAMKKIATKDGYVIIPADWIVLDEKTASENTYCYVVEIRDLFGKYNPPHFVAFGSVPARKLTSESDALKKIYKQCGTAYPEFKKWMKMQVEPIYGEPDKNGIRNIANLDEYQSAPIIGVFELSEYDGRDASEYPYGAMYVRSKEK